MLIVYDFNRNLHLCPPWLLDSTTEVKLHGSHANASAETQVAFRVWAWLGSNQSSASKLIICWGLRPGGRYLPPQLAGRNELLEEEINSSADELIYVTNSIFKSIILYIKPLLSIRVTKDLLLYTLTIFI